MLLDRYCDCRRLRRARNVAGPSLSGTLSSPLPNCRPAGPFSQSNPGTSRSSSTASAALVGRGEHDHTAQVRISGACSGIGAAICRQGNASQNGCARHCFWHGRRPVLPESRSRRAPQPYAHATDSQCSRSRIPLRSMRVASGSLTSRFERARAAERRNRRPGPDCSTAAIRKRFPHVASCLRTPATKPRSRSCLSCQWPSSNRPSTAPNKAQPMSDCVSHT